MKDPTPGKPVSIISATGEEMLTVVARFPEQGVHAGADRARADCGCLCSKE